MTYKMVDDLDKRCGRVAGAAIEHRDRITQAITERFQHKLPDGQAVPDIFQIQTWLAEELQEIHEQVLASEKSLKAELTEDRQDRELRSRYVSELRQHLFSARSLFEAMFGAGGSNAMFEEPPGFRIHIDPVPLYRQGLTVHDNILDPEFRRPLLRLDLSVDLVTLAHKMEPSLEGLGRTLQALHTGIQASAASLAFKENRMGRLDQRIGRGARLLEALYFWAEQEGIARRVRPSSHAAARASRAADSGAADPGSPSSETPDAPPDDSPPSPPDGGGGTVEPPPSGDASDEEAPPEGQEAAEPPAGETLAQGTPNGARPGR